MPLPRWELAAGGWTACTLCGADNLVRAFPAMFTPVDASARPAAALDGEAACYDHPNKRAVAACQQCGRFVCRLCAVELGALTWCPTCVAAGSGQAKAANLDTSRTLYDSIALTLPLASLIMWPFTALAAPAALVFAVARWSRPRSLVRRTRVRFVAAILISAAEVVAWVWAIAYLVAKSRTGG